jgi:AraC family transcriptional regulator
MPPREPTYALTTFDQGWFIPFDAHENSEISVVVGGSGVFYCAGEEHAIRRGSIVCIASKVVHRFSSTPGIRFCILESGDLSEAARDLFETLMEKADFRILNLSGIDLEQYEILFQSFLRLTSTQGRHQKHYIRLWIELLIVHILRTANRPSKTPLPDVAEYIRLNLHSELAVEDLSAQAGMSLSSFRTAFKNLYGVSPKQFQQQKQLEEVQWLLRSTDHSLKEIAEMVGFTHQNYLSSWFQAKVGTSPTEWRNRQQGVRDSLISDSF